jgi:hypothetical protein
VSLASKIVLSAGLPVALLLGATGIGFRHLAATDAATRRTLRHVVEVVRETGAVDEIAAAAMRLHDRWSAFRDPVYERMWSDRLDEIDRRLGALARVLESDAGRRRLASATASFARYRTLASSGRDGVVRLRAPSSAILRTVARARRRLAGIAPGLEATARAVRTHARSIERDTFEQLRAVAVLVTLLAILLSGSAALHVMRATRRLAWATEALERGRLDEPIAIRGRDALARLGSALEALAFELRERDRVGDALMCRLGDDLDDSLRSIRATTHTLADELASAGTSQQQRLAQAIGEDAEHLLHRAARIGDARQGALAHVAPATIAFDPPALLVDGSASEERS